MKTIILDTNALMAVGHFKVDLFSNLERVCDFKYEAAVLDKTVNELKNIIEQQKGKHVQHAKLALDFIEKKKIKKIKTKEGGVDNLLVEAAKKGAIILTQDRILKKRIKEAKGQLMTIRQKKKIILV